jgi:carbon-monoxide dehydrogenase large subunit
LSRFNLKPIPRKPEAEMGASHKHMKYGVGQPVRRKEDVRLVTGRGQYVDDLQLDGLAHAYFVRSPHAHALIRSLDSSAAENMPGVVGIVTSSETAGTG